MTIDSIDLSEYGAIVTDDYGISSTNVSSGFVLGGASTMPVGYSIEIKEKEIKVPIAFRADTTVEAIEQKSRLAVSLCEGTVEIYDDENKIYYSAVLSGISDENVMMDGVYKATFVFKGIMHGELISFVQDGAFTPKGFCEDGEDCRLSTTIDTLESDGSFKIAGITFYSGKVSVGTEIVIDGFKKIVYVNGAPGVGLCDIISFPKLYPGEATVIECKDAVKVEYYPIYK